jgi:Na+(H+)/acetate symporter ActP
MSAYWKIPLQFLVLLLGVLVSVFHVFNPAPLVFSREAEERLVERAAGPYAALQLQHEAALEARRNAAIALARARDQGDTAAVESARADLRREDGALQATRQQAHALVRQTTGDATFNDVNYIIPSFILEHLPVGIVGLLILAIILAATDTIAGELNSLSTATVIDFYRRWGRRSEADAHYLAASRIATGLWGVVACGVAVWAAELGSLIEVVNRIGSFFYGSVLGVFILAVAFPRATGTGAFVGLIAGMAAVAWTASATNVAFLWHNVIGAVMVVAVGLTASAVDRSAHR